jgi:hypothetical protein
MPRDPRIEIWNVLHDGEITAVSGEGGNTVTLFVSIPYLRRRVAPLGDSFVLTLSGVRQLEYLDFSGVRSSLGDELELAAPEILSTDSEQMPITVHTTSGQLLLEFDDVQFALDTGQRVSYETIVRVCGEYWKEWSAKHQKA